MSKLQQVVYSSSVTSIICGVTMAAVFHSYNALFGCGVGIAFTGLSTLIATGFAAAAGDK